jgi:hypothetical protein
LPGEVVTVLLSHQHDTVAGTRRYLSPSSQNDLLQ